MKKIVAAVLCLIMLMSLFSCNIENSNDNKDNAITSNTDSNTFIEDNHKTQLVFLPLEVSLQKKITSEEALQIASEYWETEDGSTDYGAGSMWVCHIILLDDRSSVENGYYHIGLQVDHYGRDGKDLRVLLDSSMEHLFVNAVTGECQEHVPILGNGTPVYGKG